MYAAAVQQLEWNHGRVNVKYQILKAVDNYGEAHSLMIQPDIIKPECANV